jgi:hypothetical protein
MADSSVRETVEIRTATPSTQIEEVLFSIATGFIAQGPGFAQESVVLREAVDQLHLGRDLKEQQRLLTAWHELFRCGRLSWGYNVDNPSAPFFHLPVQ